jgi:hypothetical protein
MRSCSGVDVADRIEAEHRDACRDPAAQPLDALHRRRLAGAVGADQAEDLAVPDLEGNVVNRDERPVGLADAVDLDDRTRIHRGSW